MTKSVPIIEVYVPKWMEEQECDQVKELMGILCDRIAQIDDMRIYGSCLSYALCNIAIGVMRSALEESEGKDVTSLAQIAMVVGGLTELFEGLGERIEARMPKDTALLLGEPEGNA